jgi:hypothetical protein
MRLIDRIALDRIVNTIVDLILKIVKMFAPKSDGETNPKPVSPKRKKLFPNLRKIVNLDE